MMDVTTNKALNLLKSEYWRLNNLYYIVDKRGSKVLFEMNQVQKNLHQNLWYCNVILKGRQLGISTYVLLLLIDKTLWNDNISAGIIAQTREDAEALFNRIKFAYDNLPAPIKKEIRATSDSARELAFSNGSRISVGTSMRGSTLQYLHITEFGKICAKYPDKAQEIMSGSLNTVAPGQYIFIESTAEGKEGYFYEICQQAQKLKDEKKPLSNVDFKFHFFPWYVEPTYRIGSPINLTDDHYDYFLSLKTMGIELDNSQKWWYAAKSVSQGDNMKREYPSTPQEAWEQSIDGSYYSKYIRQARIEKRICHVPYDETLPVHTAFDLGYNDCTSIWLFQVYGKEVRLIEYIEGAGESLSYWLNLLKQKNVSYGTHLAPHDIMVHEYTTGISRQVAASKLGFRLIAVPKAEIIVGIDKVRETLPKCFFDEKRCEKGIKALENYKKEWDSRNGCWSRKPLHDQYSHGADAFRTLSTGLHIITGQKSQAEIERDHINLLRDHSGMPPGSIFYEGPSNQRSRF